MRSTSLAVVLLSCVPALAAGAPSEPPCTIKLNSTYRLIAPAGWRFVECSAAAREDNRNFSLVPLDPAPPAPASPDPPVLTMYGGQVGRGTVEKFLASDREAHANAGFVPNDADGLRTADRRDVRVLQLTRRGEPFTWLAHGYLSAGPVVFWVAFECRRAEQCEAGYPAFKSLVGNLQVLRPNDANVR